MSVPKRLFQYALLYKKLIIIALFMLSISVTADMAGPFIAKRMIDSHIMGIQSSWYETEEGKNAVLYEGNWYKREEYFAEEERKGREVQILQIGTQFVFNEQPVPLNVKPILEGEYVVVEGSAGTKKVPVSILTKQQIMKFYEPEIPRIGWLAAFYFGLAVFSALFQFGQSFYLQKAANKVIRTMRNELFTHISRLPIRYFDRMPAGKIVARITNDTEAIRELYVTVLANFFTGIVTIIGVLIALLILNPKVGVTALLLIPLLIVWIIVYRRFASKYNHVIRARISDINAMINESILGMNVIKAFGREKETKDAFEKLNSEHYLYKSKMQNLNSLTGYNLLHVVKTGAFVLFVWYFGGLSMDGATIISLGMLYAVVDLISRLLQPVNGIVSQFANLEQALVAGERVFDLLDEPGETVKDQRIPRYKGDVEFKNVSFAYIEGEYVLRNIQFVANQGETIALVGHTGSGKSSIMNLLFRFYDKYEGDILIDGMDVRHIPLQGLREHMAIVLQDPFLFTGTIASNISLNDERITREMVEQALKSIGGESILHHLPLGLDEPVIEKGSTLSAGQKQLISFARALAFNPAILILDEATSSIDSETETIIQQALDVVKQGRTTFIIAHRLSTIKNADLILVLDKGEIVEQGKHDELLALNGKYGQMYQLQVGGRSG